MLPTKIREIIVEKPVESVGSETQTQPVLTLGLDQIAKFIKRPLVRVMNVKG
jgi:hypothetical protein